MDIIAVFDTNAESLATVESLMDAPLLTTSELDRFLQTPVPDLTVIATTAPSHAILIEALASHGRKVIICEKPLATSISEAIRVSELVDSEGLTIAVNHQMRFMDQYLSVRRFQTEFSLGQLCSMTVSGANFGLRSM